VRSAPPELVAAIKAGDAAAVRERLAAEPALASARDEAGLSLVLLALFNQRREVADALLEAGPELGPLEAAAVGRANRLRELLAADTEALRARTPEGFTPIGLAAFLGGPEAVRVLLEHGADPDDDAHNPLRVRPVHAAAAAGDHESMRLLLEAGADPDARQQNGFTPLHAAAHRDDVETARLLLAHGADPALATDDGRDAARIAADDGSDRVAALLG
jgi:ankyrin repeat protein